METLPVPESPGLPQVHLKIERRSSHPWVFQKMVEKPAVKVPGGSIVDVLDRAGQWVGRAFYNGHSRITLRVLTDDPGQAIDDGFFQKRIDRAVQFRRDVLGLGKHTDAYRLVHSEGDELSGLVVDRFGPTIVLEFFAAGAYRCREPIMAALRTHYPDAQFYWFAEDHVQKQESFNCKPMEAPPPVVITEHGVRFRVAPGTKHKTGFFADQRENRHGVAQFCSGKRVLDVCCNTGGFAVYAKVLGQAEEVVGLDLDEGALELAKQNANLNQARVRWVQSDLFPWLRDAIQNGQRFDVVILDPAKQTRDREEIEYALKRYVDMNRLALQVVTSGGIFLTCSCTGLIREDQFLDAVRRAAWQAGRTVQVFRVTGAGPDHPFLGHVQESRYLKAVWCRVS